MSKLTACFNIQLDQWLFAKGQTEKEYAYKTRIDDFDVEIRLLPKKNGPKAGFTTETDVTFCISEISICVSKDLAVEIPPIVIKGPLRDYTLRAPFFLKYSRDYEKIAYKTLKRIIKYFKYKLHNPLLEQISESSQCFLSPIWYDENDNEVNPGIHLFSAGGPPGMTSYDFGITRLTAESEPELGKAIENEIDPELYEEILSDAQSAIFQKNYRRAVLEMAMACELVIKQTYFSKSTAAGRAHEYMEDKQKISMNITDYIDGVAEYALGERFGKASSKDEYINIQHLFRGRNKIVHRGELIFKDDKGDNHPINEPILKKWWKSVERLLAWLNSKRLAQQNVD
jgi:hypothetical protein